MDNEMNYCYDVKFEGNILVVGRITYRTKTFGLTDFTLAYQIQLTNSG